MKEPVSAADAAMYANNTLVIPPSRSAAAIEKALTYARQASQSVWKHSIVLIGLALYLVFIVLATVFYAPSYYACMARGGTLWSLSNAIVNGVFMVFLVFYVLRQFFEIDGPGGGTSNATPIVDPSSALYQFIKGFDDLLPYILSACVIFLILSYGVLFFKCRDNPDCPSCTPKQATAFNSIVTAQVNRSMSQLKDLLAFYTDYSKNRVSIALCANYYSNAYLGVAQNSSGSAQCNAATSESGVDGKFTVRMGQPRVNPKQIEGAPLLNQFYVMTSGRTCAVQHQYDSYMTPAMIRIALTGGARALDFEVTNYAYKQDSFPIVTHARNRDNKNLQHNFVLFEDVLRTIVSEWIEPQQNLQHPADPLFLRFVLDTALTQSSMDQMAYLLQYYLNEQTGSFLLPSEMNYKALAQSQTNIGNMPLAFYYGYIVILVYSPCPNVTTQFEKSMLAELTSALCTTSAESHASALGAVFPDDKGAYQVLSARYVQSIVPTSASSNAVTDTTSAYHNLVDTNTGALTYVDTSFTPYSTVKTMPGTGCFNPNDTQSKGSDSVTSLLLNKVTINNSPVPAIETGCQFIAMNFQDISAEMKLYLAMFDRSSFILKPSRLWNTNTFGAPPPPLSMCDLTTEVPYTNNDDPNYCYEVCVPNGSTLKNPVKHTDPSSNTQTGTPGAFTKLTPVNNATHTCIQPGYKVNNAITLTAYDTLNNPIANTNAFNKSSDP